MSVVSFLAAALVIGSAGASATFLPPASAILFPEAVPWSGPVWVAPLGAPPSTSSGGRIRTTADCWDRAQRGVGLVNVDEDEPAACGWISGGLSAPNHAAEGLAVNAVPVSRGLQGFKPKARRGCGGSCH